MGLSLAFRRSIVINDQRNSKEQTLRRFATHANDFLIAFNKTKL